MTKNSYWRHAVSYKNNNTPIMTNTPFVIVESQDYLEHWGFQHKKNMDVLEWVQRRTTEVIKGLEYLSCENRLRELGFFILK